MMKIDFDKTAEYQRRIAEAVQSAPIQECPAWSELTDYYQAKGIPFELFAIDCSSDSVQVFIDRSFDTRADVHMAVTFTCADGFQTEGSQTLPCMVYGRIDPKGEIHVERFKFHLA